MVYIQARKATQSPLTLRTELVIKNIHAEESLRTLLMLYPYHKMVGF